MTTDDEVDNAIRFIRNYCASWERSNFTVKVEYRNETFHITADLCRGFVVDVLACGMKKAGLRESEYAKYTVSHFKRMLL